LRPFRIPTCQYTSHLVPVPRGLRRGLRPLACWDCGFGSVDMYLLWVLCVVRERSVRRADHSSRGILQSVVCLSVIEKPRH
jgi:hypothetical protein